MTEPDLEQIKQPRNHWNDDGDLVIEQKTLFRHVGYLGHSGTWYPNDGSSWPSASQEPGGYSPLYQQIATWEDGGWRD